MRVLLRRLERSRLGGLEALDRMIRSDILDWTWSTATRATQDRATQEGASVAIQSLIASRAADVLVDGVAAAYADEALAEDVRRQLEGPLLASVATLTPGSSSDLPPATVTVMDQLRALDRSRPVRSIAVQASVSSPVRPSTDSLVPAAETVSRQSSWRSAPGCAAASRGKSA